MGLRREAATRAALHFGQCVYLGGHFGFARRLDANSGGVGGDDVGHRGGVLVGFGVGE